MVSLKLRERGWYVNQAGTRYVRDKAKPKPVKEKMPDVSMELAPFLKGEAQGDFQLAVLLAVRNLLKDADRYIKHTRAVGKNGQPTEPTGGDAVRWNIFGALEFFTHSVPRPLRTQIIRTIKQHLPSEWRHSLAKWEEDRFTTHSHVVRVLDNAVGVYRMTAGGPEFIRR